MMGRNALLSHSVRSSRLSLSWLARTNRAPKQTSLESPCSSFSSSSYSSSSSSLLSSFGYLKRFPYVPTSSFSSPVTLRLLNTKPSTYNEETDETEDEAWKGEISDGWMEEDEAEPKLGDGGAGGGVVLGAVPWGERALSIAQEVMLQFGDDMKLYAFKTTSHGYVYVRLNKLSDKYGCPSMEEIENYNNEYKKRVEVIGEEGDIPNDLGIQVSSPGADRVLKVPDDLDRFKDMPMRVCYIEGDLESKCPEKEGFFLLESIETDSGHCVWKMADVKENRGLLGKGRPLNRKQKDWRLRLPFESLRMVLLYLD